MNRYRDFYNELNQQQKAAVDTVDGPVLVLAGPGTGKTQLLSVRAASILEKRKVRPENILILTYTNSAAKAMKERLAKVIGPQGYDVEVGTFHSFANSIIQKSEAAANYVGDKIPMDDVERMRAIEYAIDNAKGVDDIRPFRAPYTYAKEVLQKIGDLKKDGITPADLDKYLKDGKSSYRYMEDKYIRRLKALSAVYGMYEGLKEGGAKDIFDERGRYDFDDMIIFAATAFRNEPGLRDEYRDQYRYIMVDEYQDTNGAQLDLLFTLCDRDNPNLCCVGDDDQSIYRFQGASVGNFRLLTERYPRLKRLSLKDNYRSSKELVDISKRIAELIPVNERVEEKALVSVREWGHKEMIFREFTTEEEELLYVVEKVRELKERVIDDPHLTEEERAHPYNNIAILVRKRNDILRVVDALLKAGIPYATDGKEDISGEKRVKQLLDVLELAHIEPKEYELKDLALYKVLTADYMGIPHIDVLAFISRVNDMRRDRKREIALLGEFLKCFSGKKGAARFKDPSRLQRAAKVIKGLLEDADSQPVHSLLMDFIKDSGIFKFILNRYEKRDILRIRQLRALGSFVNMVKASDMAKPAIRLGEFMEELKTRRAHDLPIQGNLVTLTQEGVRVYTAHGSKGLEFHSVILPFCLHNKNWPMRPIPDKIQLAPDIFKTKERITDKNVLKELTLQDETRLFYVAMTRARSNLIFTASPTDDLISSLYIDRLDIHKERPEDVREEELIARSLETTDLEDPFVGTEEVLRDMVSALTLNPTRLNTYLRCRRKFLYNDVLKLPGTKKRSLVFGNCVHKALEHVWRIYMETKVFPAYKAFNDVFSRELKFQGVDEVMRRECVNRLATVKMCEWFEEARRNPIMPIGLERKLMVTVGDNIIFTGKYDKIEWKNEARGLVRIIDYKTGKPDDHLKKIDLCDDLVSADCDEYLRQLVAYKLLFEKDKKESRGRRVEEGVLVFIEPLTANLGRLGYKKGEHVAKSVRINDDMVKQLGSVITKVWGQISELRFEKLPAHDKDICGRCDFAPICWEEA